MQQRHNIFNRFEYFIDISSLTGKSRSFFELSYVNNKEYYYPVCNRDFRMLKNMQFVKHMLHMCVFFDYDYLYFGFLRHAEENKLFYNISRIITFTKEPNYFIEFEKFQQQKLIYGDFKIYRNKLWDNPYFNNFLISTEKIIDISEITDISVVYMHDNMHIMALFKKPIFVYNQGFCWTNGSFDKTSTDFWTIKHLQTTGIVMSNGQLNLFNDYRDFYDLIINLSKSELEKRFIRLYCAYLQKLPLDKLLSTPMLIPEFRFKNQFIEHQFRLDFLIINLRTKQTLGIEISPESTHATPNHYREQREHDLIKSNKFLMQYGIPLYTIPCSSLNDISFYFDEIKKKYLLCV